MFGRAPLARETVIASFVEGARVRADALAVLADTVGGESLVREVRTVLVADPPPVRAEGTTSCPRSAPPTPPRNAPRSSSPTSLDGAD